ncbi:multicopper oxidase CueO [Microbulbifer sp. THAF38]|uniref:multicopper oxidase CueO n=1 Tax=Microbulbifer sp. THAF38 TaxID=2587856 RepID=UPI0012696FE3|nr:multicopper oxidase CueO [Microbulbifer sp. THAF38]QFT56224.1 Blue copper oxidase CueO precursor [Microbulbifer sp. THAF38]
MSRLSRRDFCLGTLAASLLTGAHTKAQSTGPADSSTRPLLPIPPVLRADSSGKVDLVAKPAKQTFLKGVTTPTYGFNGPFLGPALRFHKGETVVANVHNLLTQNVTAHWHGLIVPGHADGGPYMPIKPGQTWTAKLPIIQQAATLWFHPHLYPTTAELVLKGLAGLIIIDDENSDALPLPKRWGVDDIPVIIQDRRFNKDGSFFHCFNEITVAAGYCGDHLLTNGVINPVVKPPKGWLRFRILDGSNGRNYRLSTSDQRPLYVIATDGGFLPEPVEVKELPIAAGERYEVMVDARNGQPFDFLTLPVPQQVMRLPPFDGPVVFLSVLPSNSEGQGTLPEQLVSMPDIPTTLPPVSQQLVMQMNRRKISDKLIDATGLEKMVNSGTTDPAVVAKVLKLITEAPALPLKAQLTANAVSGVSFSFTEPGFKVPINKDLRWRISEGSDTMLHPVHIHGCQFRLIKLNDATPPPYMRGWKDTVPISNAGSAEIYVRFPLEAMPDMPYMVHCHVLEHEDSGMMTEFSVT